MLLDGQALQFTYLRQIDIVSAQIGTHFLSGEVVRRGA